MGPWRTYRAEVLDKYDAKRTFRKPSFGDEKPTRKVESGIALLDNNKVNFIMALHGWTACAAALMAAATIPAGVRDLCDQALAIARKLGLISIIALH